jgi:hypothetical protein
LLLRIRQSLNERRQNGWPIQCPLDGKKTEGAGALHFFVCIVNTTVAWPSVRHVMDQDFWPNLARTATSKSESDRQDAGNAESSVHINEIGKAAATRPLGPRLGDIPRPKSYRATVVRSTPLANRPDVRVDYSGRPAGNHRRNLWRAARYLYPSRVGVDCYNLRGACTDRCERGPSKAELQVTPDACCEDTLEKRVLTVEQVWITKCGRRSGRCLRGKSWAYF